MQGMEMNRDEDPTTCIPNLAGGRMPGWMRGRALAQGQNDLGRNKSPAKRIQTAQGSQ